SAATTRAFADQGGYEVDLGRDFIGVGAGSIVAGLSGAFAVNASPPRTAAIASAGGKTQAAPVMTAAAVIAVIPAMGLLKDLPLATLAAVLIGVAIRIFHVRDMRAVLRFDYFEFALAIVTLLAVALVGVEQGIAVAVGLAILDRARLAARPSVHRMGRIPGTTSWEPEKAEAGGSKRSDLEQEPGVLVLLFASPVYFANAGHFRTQFQAFLKAAGPGVRAVVIDAVGMNDIDFTGAHYVANMLDQMDKAGIAVAFARAGEHLKSNLDRAGLGKRIGADHFFDSTDAAAAAMGSPGAGVSGPAS
ncbi:MAG TPA: SulP family inorganic anion transporter, partial [Acidimicrobiales bacterium]|nr:SulP family inorganic anion transporter [Acidimicrobiales bacterium]